MTINPVLEFESDGDWESELGYAAGLSLDMRETLRAGIEFKGNESGHYIGPTISHGRENLWAALGTIFGYADLETGKPEMQIRFLMGIGVVD